MMKKILLGLYFLIPFTAFAAPSDLLRPTGIDLINNCSKLLDKKERTSKENSKQFEKAIMLIICTTATSNTYQTIRGPMIAMRNADIVCYQDYYQLTDKSDLLILKMTIDYIKKHPSYSDTNLSIIMSLMMNEYYPIPDICKK
ncbi:TPA: hypothetical protein I8Z14_000560 [Legionella pneumophila]|nr:hypothetical protein [Legionella pneumophila]